MAIVIGELRPQHDPAKDYRDLKFSERRDPNQMIYQWGSRMHIEGRLAFHGISEFENDTIYVRGGKHYRVRRSKKVTPDVIKDLRQHFVVEEKRIKGKEYVLVYTKFLNN